MEFKCLICNKEFTKNTTWQKCCSTKCGNRLYYLNNKQKIIQRTTQNYYKNHDANLKLGRKRSLKNTKNGTGAFVAAKQRCTNPKSKSFIHYGARGIKFLITKKDFLEIYWSTNHCEKCNVRLEDDDRRKGINSRNIDRINGTGHYENSNLRVVCKSCNSVVK